MKKQLPTDDKLMSLFRETGDPAAFEALVRRYRKPLFAYLYRCTGDRFLTEDLFQETFLRIYEGRRSYNPELAFSAWAYRIATNACIDQRKKKSHAMEKAVGDEVLHRHAAAGDGPDRALQSKNLSRIVLGLLDELPENYRTVLLLAHYQELPVRDIAIALGIPAGTVKSRLYKGFKKLATLVEKRGLSDEM